MSRLLIFFVFLLSCGSRNTTLPNNYLTDEKKNAIMWQVVHYASKPAPTATRDSMFDSKFDDYYQRVLLDFELVALSPGGSNDYYFLIFRPARSVNPMFEGIGGKFKFAHGSLVAYDEIFRTWKMPYQDLSTRGALLFDRMTKEKDLSIYYSKYAGDKYIEFPNDRYVFDKVKRRWRNRELDSLYQN